MAHIKQFTPKIFQNDNPIIAEFNSTHELLNIPFVRKFAEDLHGEPDFYFHRYSISGNNLIVECNDGKYKWVIGVIDDISKVTLPVLEND